MAVYQANDAVIEGVAGAIGAVIALTSTYPLLTVGAERKALRMCQQCPASAASWEGSRPLTHPAASVGLNPKGA